MSSTRRTALKALAAGLIVPRMVMTSSNAWSQAPATKKAYSLHVGVNRVNKAAYGGANVQQLGGCVNDAKTYEAIARSRAFTPLHLYDDLATIENVSGHIRWAAHDLQDGDIFLITYAGHGSQMRDTSGDESDGDGKDETWCLYNGQLRDDELYGMWSEFNAGVRILVISDSCHSGTVAREFDAWANITRDLEQVDTEKSAIARSIPEVATNPNNPLLSRARSRSTGVPLEVVDPNGPFLRALTEEQAEIADKFQSSQPIQLSRDLRGGEAAAMQAVRATGLLLAGCQDSQLSMEVSQHGFFTATLEKTFKPDQFRNYFDFVGAITSRMNSANQIPNTFPFGVPNDDFYRKQSPFTV